MVELQTTRLGDCFCDSYANARAQFREAAKTAGAFLDQHVHPQLRGPRGEQLSVDVAVLGASHTHAAFVLISGTHGVEGYAGSGIQIALLRGGLIEQLAQQARVVLIHAINPYGFAYARRANEDNVDLNRNFVDFDASLPANSTAGRAAKPFTCGGEGIEHYRVIRARRARARDADEYRAFLQALQPGQYDEPSEVFYGGCAPVWSNTMFRRVCREHLRGCARVSAIDLHTGLGPKGVGELLFVGKDSPAHRQRYGEQFPPPVSVAGQPGSVSAEVRGTLLSALEQECSSVELIAAILEFGTLSLPDVMDALILENWAHHHLPAAHPWRAESSQQLRAAFYCEGDARWMESLVARTSEVALRAAAFLVAPR